MGILSRFRRRRTAPYAATTDEERAARYVYLLNTLPASVIESAHATAFAEVPEERRREMFERLRPFLSDAERDTARAEPVMLARLVRRAEEARARREQERGEAAAERGTVLTEARPGHSRPDQARADEIDPRQTMLTVGVLSVVAHNFLLSSALVSYFTVGAGSLSIAGEPEWVAATFDPASQISGDGSFGGGYGDSGGGFDGGGYGGFDGGGFGGGGFDGGGGGF
ncbi:hypothetical protein N3K63_06550 [Microbacterium sp. W1N]|uniref:hypothetical protein n=1 Tax=Microbacterium festucae TaxID=2977531 RepID=UPI0021C05D4A|nr:hypothetical protein [Microbacterium festucae]MCT9819948.1 hypothetical protein [Microbacterium festucae]